MNNDSVAVIIPVAPEAKPEHVIDTVASVKYYMPNCDQILIMDNSGTGTGQKVQAKIHGVDVMIAPDVRNAGVKRYWMFSDGLLYALQHYQFSALLRLDTDALVIGAGAEKDALRVFGQDPRVGWIGSYKVDCNGVPRDASWARGQLQQETSWETLWRHPERLAGILWLRRVLRQAKANGYELGDSCLGGAFFVSAECIHRLVQSRFLGRKEIGWSVLGEDHIFGLLVPAAGMRMGDLATGDLPLGLRWRGLPCSPQDLVLRGKKVIHSTRYWEDLDEVQVRNFFRNYRSS